LRELDALDVLSAAVILAAIERRNMAQVNLEDRPTCETDGRDVSTRTK
jgi:hypothetical protein